MTDKKCPKCGAEMEEGYVPDFGYGIVLVPRWFAGAAEISRWLGVKTRGKLGLPISTYSCVSCGFLESYTQPAETTPTS